MELPLDTGLEDLAPLGRQPLTDNSQRSEQVLPIFFLHLLKARVSESLGRRNAVSPPTELEGLGRCRLVSGIHGRLRSRT